MAAKGGGGKGPSNRKAFVANMAANKAAGMSNAQAGKAAYANSSAQATKSAKKPGVKGPNPFKNLPPLK